MKLYQKLKMNLKFIAVAVSMVAAQSNGFADNAPAPAQTAGERFNELSEPRKRRFLVSTIITGHVAVIPLSRKV